MSTKISNLAVLSSILIGSVTAMADSMDNYVGNSIVKWMPIAIRYQEDVQTHNRTVGSYRGKSVNLATALEQVLDETEMKGVRKAIVTTDKIYTEMAGERNQRKYVSTSMFHRMNRTDACELNAEGACVVVEKYSKGTTAYVLGTLRRNQHLIYLFRKDITDSRTKKYFEKALETESAGVTTVVYSPKVVEKMNLTAEDLAPRKSDWDRATEETLIVSKLKNDTVRRLPISREHALNYILVETEVGQREADVAVKSIKRSLPKESLAEIIKMGLPMTCYVGGTIRKTWVVGLRIDAMLDRVSSESMANVYCYHDAKVVAKLAINVRLSENALGLRLPGTRQLVGAFGIGAIDSLLDIVTTDLGNGMVLPYNKQKCVLGADAGYIFGLGFSALCVRDGKYQPAYLGAAMRFGLSAGLTVSIGEVQELGLDSSNFGIAE